LDAFLYRETATGFGVLNHSSL